MPNDEKKVNPLFLQLVLSLQSAAWYQLGKTVSPISGKIERDLNEARVSIDLLTMIQEKTKGNLLEDEKKILDNTIYTLQMNYIDEMNRGDEMDETAPPEAEKPGSDSSETEEKGNSSRDAAGDK
jgi:hypothetical protein